MNEVSQALARLIKRGCYGHLEIDIADGEIVVVRETHTTKLQSRRGNTRVDQPANR